MNASSTVALILPPQTDSIPPAVDALDRQSRRPEQIVVVGSVAELSGALATAGDSGIEWVWFLDAAVTPDPGALDAMLEVAALASPTPALLASRILTQDGSVDPVSLAVAEVHNGERVLAALEQRTVPLRVARRGSLLVRAEIAAQLDAVDVLERDLVWSARLLGREVGVLVPRSVAVRQAAERIRPLALGTVLRVLRELPPRERLWFATHFAEEMTARPRAWRCRASRPGRR